MKNLKKLTELIRPAGFCQTKPKRLFDFCSFAIEEYNGLENLVKEDLEITREKLLALYGIGPETADTILLYALDRPTFIIDEYTKRLVIRERLARALTYDYLKQLFEENLPQDVEVYQNFHALIIIEQKGKEGSVMKIV